MSSKSAPDAPAPAAQRTSRAWSLAARLTAWYAGTSFVLILAATGLLYWALVANLDREDDHLLADKVRVLRAVLLNRPGDTAAIRQEVEEAWEARQHTRVYVRILDEDGQVLTETPGMGQLLPPASFPTPAAEPGEGADFRSDTGRSLRVLAVQAAVGVPGRSPHVVQVALDRSQEVELLADYRKNLWLVLGAALVLCAVAGYQIAKRGIRPIHDITDTARRIHPTNLGERIAADGLPAELLTLADTFNRMLDRLERSFVRLSQFSADIAHELRTPLNNLRGEAEVALGKSRTPQEYWEVIGSSLEEYERLSYMIDSLLFLARAENPSTQVVSEPVDVGQELRRLRDFYEAAAEAGVRLTVACAENLVAPLDRTLLQRAVGNLVENALAHTPPQGTVTMTATKKAGWLRIEVADTGHGIDPAHLPHLFDRFYRVDQARRSGKGGNVGLGLPIVKSITELHGGTAEITSEVSKGTTVALCFPMQPSHIKEDGEPR